MGERVTRIQMQAFRGVPEEFVIELPDGVSAVVYGDNATGKSTVADALEWYFTGVIDFLRAEGRQNAIRHVGAKPTVGTSVTVETSGHLSGTRTLAGDTEPGVMEAGRDTFLLRGRSLTAFVERSKGEKWKALAEILGLAEVDSLRLDLQRARNDLSRIADDAARHHCTISTALVARVSPVDEDSILAAIAQRCQGADVAVPTSLQEALDPKWWEGLTAAPQTHHAALVAGLTTELRVWSPQTVDHQVLEHWNNTVGSHTSPNRAQLRLFQAADSFLTHTHTSDTCPLCGQPVDSTTLREQVSAVLQELQNASAEFELMTDGVRGAADQLEGDASRACRVPR
ncbi:MAG: AAA family ATPase [Micromonosporaceae bacterium]